ncbi:UNVERIFIED_CONTAM: hypothetical protein Sradi_4849200 [Sesamum radiatum]|uniref:Uncharacterized protein n=1 Tax=Sesamum radiatum TaxID=300843 RepID=A0AAW2N010_SESRA
MELYLGHPSRVTRSKRALFDTIRDRVWIKITGWNEKLMSQAGKEVLIKSVNQAIPTYAIGCFRLPITLLKEIHSMVAKFWWGSRGQRKIYWVSWDRLCVIKLMGGLGFRQLHLFNLAMLANNFGGFGTTRINSSAKCSKLSISLMVMCSRQPWVVVLLLLGVVYWRHRICFGQGVGGVWARVHVFGFSLILGSLDGDSFRPITPAPVPSSDLCVSALIDSIRGD